MFVGDGGRVRLDMALAFRSWLDETRREQLVVLGGPRCDCVIRPAEMTGRREQRQTARSSPSPARGARCLEASVWLQGQTGWYATAVEGDAGVLELVAFPVRPDAEREFTVEAYAPGYERTSQDFTLGEQVLLTLIAAD